MVNFLPEITKLVIIMENSRVCEWGREKTLRGEHELKKRMLEWIYFLSKGKIRNIIFKMSKATFRKMATASDQKKWSVPEFLSICPISSLSLIMSFFCKNIHNKKRGWKHDKDTTAKGHQAFSQERVFIIFSRNWKIFQHNHHQFFIKGHQLAEKGLKIMMFLNL